jgi:hypothetical protein
MREGWTGTIQRKMFVLILSCPSSLLTTFLLLTTGKREGGGDEGRSEDEEGMRKG